MASQLWLLLVAPIATLAAYFLTGFLKSYLQQSNIIDRPNQRSMHSTNVPRGGGLVIVIGVLMAVVMAMFETKAYLFNFSLAGIVLAWAMLGWRDDQKNLPVSFRLMVQIALALVSCYVFGSISEVRFSDSVRISLYWLSVPLTTILLLWIVNLVNFMDGIDGLAASQSVIIGISFASWFWWAGSMPMVLICSAQAAASYGFLMHNWSPARIFLGDVGSISIGGLFGLYMLIGVNYFDMPVISFLLALAVFMTDASLTLVQRLSRRERVWEAHRSHLYQRLVISGFPQAKVTLLYIVMMCICSILASISIIDHDMIISATIITLLLMTFAVLTGIKLLRAANS